MRRGTCQPGLYRRTVRMAAAILFCVLLLLQSGNAHAQDVGSPLWSPPQRLSEETLLGWFPDIEADLAGRLHVVWAAPDPAYDIVLYATSPNGMEWTPPRDVIAGLLGPNGESYVPRPRMTIARSGAILLGHHGLNDDLTLYSSAYDTAETSWGWSPEDVVDDGYHVQPWIADDGITHLITTKPEGSSLCDQCYTLLYRRRENGDVEWSEPIDVSRNPARGAAKPTMVVDGNRLFLVWESGLDGNRGYVVDPATVYFNASDDNGRTWRRPLPLDPLSALAALPGGDGTIAAEGASASASGTLSRNVALGMDGNKTLVAAWWRMPQNEIAFRYSQDGGLHWSAPQTIPGIWGVGIRSMTRQDRYVMTTDGAGRLHLLAVGSRSPDTSELALLHFVWEGMAWSQPESVATSRTDLLEWPDATVRLGNELHVVWHVRPNALVDVENVGTYSVWHSRRMLNAPAQAPQELAASLPPAVPTLPPPLPTLSPPATPTPAAVSFLPMAVDGKGASAGLVLPSNIRSENDEMLMVALALVPAAGVLAIFLLLAHARRKA